MTKVDKRELMTAVAKLGAHCADFPMPSPTEKELLKSIEFLCMAFMSVIDEER